MSKGTTKKTVKRRGPPAGDDLRPEYKFDYSKSRPNRFAKSAGEGCRMIVLDPDVAAVFKSPADVNSVLRALISTMPSP